MKPHWVLLVSALLPSCGQQTNASRRTVPDETPVGKIEYGRTTASDVKDLMGEPDSTVTIESGLERWTYWTIEEASGHYSHQKIMIDFNPDGTVRKLSSTQVAP